MPERRTPFVIGALIVIVVGAVVVWGLSGERNASAGMTEITDRSAAESQVHVSRVGIATGENYLGHKIRAISGTIANTSDKSIRLVDLRMIFLDYDEKPIQETVERGYDVTQKPLIPGAEYHFEINFENLPKTWNHRIPRIEVAKVAY